MMKAEMLDDFLAAIERENWSEANTFVLFLPIQNQFPEILLHLEGKIF